MNCGSVQKSFYVLHGGTTAIYSYIMKIKKKIHAISAHTPYSLSKKVSLFLGKIFQKISTILIINILNFLQCHLSNQLFKDFKLFGIVFMVSNK